ncbi:hypothetical protein SLA2020_284150 [Shorea laevis]
MVGLGACTQSSLSTFESFADHCCLFYELKTTVLLAPAMGEGRVVAEESSEICLYEDHFRVGLCLPFPRVVRKVLARINLVLT